MAPPDTSALVADPFAPVFTKNGRTYRCVASLAGLERLAETLAAVPVLAFDWETTTALLWDPTFDYLGISLAASTTEAYYIPIGHELPPQRSLFTPVAPPKISLEAIRTHLGPILQRVELLMHNAKFDASVCRRAGLPFNAQKIWDTYIAASLVNSTRESFLNLKHLTREWLGREVKELKDIAADYNMRHVPLELVLEYAGDDACNTYALWEVERARFAQCSSRVSEIFRRLEMPIVPLVAKMEQTGIRVDRSRLEEISRWADRVRTKALEFMRRRCDFPFDPARPEHVRSMLYDRLCLPVARKGGKETAERKQLKVIFETMKEPQKSVARPFFKAWMAWGQAQKILTTYTHSIWDNLDQNGRIHPSFFQVDTMTGRMSSGKPVNFQNMPRDDGLLDVRSAFIPDPGWVFILADYSQMEFKIAAGLSGDSKLVAAANDRKADVHTATARAIFHIPDDEPVTDEQRQAAKTTTYAIQYLTTPFGLSKQLLVKEPVAKQIIVAFFGLYPGLKQWILRTQQQITDQGFSETYYGRRRWGNPKFLQSPVPELREDELRKLTNHVVQGTGADVTKLAMKRVDRWFRQEHLQSWIAGQIHDELVILSPLTEAVTVARKVEELMRDRIGDVTLPVDATIKVSLSKSKQAKWPGACHGGDRAEQHGARPEVPGVEGHGTPGDQPAGRQPPDGRGTRVGALDR
jgi:DNA polymerase-1